MTTKKLTRSKRKELRVKGQLKPVSRLDEARKAAEKQAEEASAGARVHEAREAIAHREENDDLDAATAKPKKRPDLTMLVLLGVLGLAALVFYLSQRSPTPPEPKAASSADATTGTP